MNDFTTVFVIPKEFDVSLIVGAIASLVLITICVADIVLRKKGRKGLIPWPTWTLPPTFGIVVGSILLMGISFVLVDSALQTNKLLSAYNQGKYKIAEGIVDVSHMQQYGGSGRGDIVRIGSEEFEIDYTSFTPGYSLTIAYGGVLKNGVYARVYHRKGIIMRIDIRKRSPVDNK
ncbi:MAG: hypothetical protein GY774_18995 [Planctomycetes bacterium]|nr:hypothetical protein [Planctomycetota bacterium]